MEENEDDEALHLEARIALCSACRFGNEPCCCGDNTSFLVEDFEDDDSPTEWDLWLKEQEEEEWWDEFDDTFED